MLTALAEKPPASMGYRGSDLERAPNDLNRIGIPGSAEI